MEKTKLLAASAPSGDVVGPVQSQLAQLDLSRYRFIRLSIGAASSNPASLGISLAHVAEPNTPNANLIAALDFFTLAPGDWVSRLYQVPGQTVAFSASPEGQASGCQLDYTLYAWND